MATLVLGAVGTLVGGPLGGAIGSLIGNQLDRTVLTTRRKGPRLGDLTVQTSSYGSQIPKLFGTMRVSGTVIWATDLKEDKHHSGSAKTGTAATTYSYSASFAVALSARPILSVGRIWADGNLLRGVAGDFKSETGFRLYLGSEDQAVDPLIAAAEGIASTPAHRGLAYAVFDTMQLADFGNRIPSLTFEVTADDGAVTIGAIACALSGGAIADGGGQALGGFAASGDSVRGALEAMVQACPMPLSDDGSVLRFADTSLATIDPAALGGGVDGKAQPSRQRDRQDAGTLPDSVALTYYEPARDYQAGLQRARRDGVGRRDSQIELPAAIDADSARMLAEDALGRAWRERDRATARLPWRYLSTRAGTLVTLGEDGPWRVAGWTLERMALELTLRRSGDAGPLLTGATAGRATAGADAVAGATVLRPLDLPALDDTPADAPRLWLAAAGTGAGWRRATVSTSLDGGASWRVVGQTAPPATMGSAATALPAGSTTLFDRVAGVDVELLHDGMALAGADDTALVAGANLAMLGDELIQFGGAEQVSATRWRLSRLVRGRRGSEWATGAHAAGERFVLIEAATLLALDVPLAALGTTLALSAVGPGDDSDVTAAIAVTGSAVRPPTPVDLAVDRLADGTLAIRWTRRSRLGWAWLDGGDVPLGEDAERYRLRLVTGSGAVRTVETTSAGYAYLPADQASDGLAAHGTLGVTVEQLGTNAASAPAASAHWTL